MTWTTDHSILLAREICGYEVQTSPRGVHYVIEDGRTRPLPDFPNDPGETLTTLDAWLQVNDGAVSVVYRDRSARVCLMSKYVLFGVDAPTGSLTAAIAEALYQAVRK